MGTGGGLAPSGSGDEGEEGTENQRSLPQSSVWGSRCSWDHRGLGRRAGQRGTMEEVPEGWLPPGLTAHHLSPEPHKSPRWTPPGVTQPVPRSSEIAAFRGSATPSQCVLPFRRCFPSGGSSQLWTCPLRDWEDHPSNAAEFGLQPSIGLGPGGQGDAPGLFHVESLSSEDTASKKSFRWSVVSLKTGSGAHQRVTLRG